MKKIAVCGAGGMLGHKIVAAFVSAGFQVKPIGRSQFDIESDPIEKLSSQLSEMDYVINCAALLRASAENQESLSKVNSGFPNLLAEHLDHQRTRLIHISTDGVFSAPAGDANERDTPAPADPYGTSKLMGEPPAAMVIRASFIGHEKSRKSSFLERLLRQRNSEVKAYKNHFWNGLTSSCLAKAILQLVKNDEFFVGPLHLHSPSAVSRLELIEQINRLYELNNRVIPVMDTQDRYQTLSSIHKYSAKYCSRPIEEQLVAMQLEFMNK